MNECEKAATRAAMPTSYRLRHVLASGWLRGLLARGRNAGAHEVIGECLDLAVTRIGYLPAGEHSEPRLTDASTISHFPQRLVGRFQLRTHEFEGVHDPSYRQNSAKRKRQDFFSDGRQYLPVRRLPPDYRTILGENIAALLKARGLTSATLKATYLDGPKKGDEVSERSVRNIINGHGNAPGLDMVAAIAARLGVSVWQLLTRIDNPARLPTLALTDEERKLHIEFNQWRRRFRASDGGGAPPTPPA